MAAGIGIDLVDVERFALVLARRRGIAERLFTALELSQAAGATPAARAGRLAARFAAKEAVLKSLGVGLGAARFRDIEVRRLDSGRPELRLAGAAAQLAAERGVTRWHVSLSHTGLTAAAVVHAETSDARPES
ncbi:MAG TPA: holo-ACP synthase [Acidimicrobiaceae bacterium]|nr:holo-ACP synthase [Acidimicrobiaceae bacterium]